MNQLAEELKEIVGNYTNYYHTIRQTNRNQSAKVIKALC